MFPYCSFYATKKSIHGVSTACYAKYIFPSLTLPRYFFRAVLQSDLKGLWFTLVAAQCQADKGQRGPDIPSATPPALAASATPSPWLRLPRSGKAAAGWGLVHGSHPTQLFQLLWWALSGITNLVPYIIKKCTEQPLMRLSVTFQSSTPIRKAIKCLIFWLLLKSLWLHISNRIQQVLGDKCTWQYS